MREFIQHNENRRGKIENDQKCGYAPLIFWRIQELLMRKLICPDCGFCDLNCVNYGDIIAKGLDIRPEYPLERC